MEDWVEYINREEDLYIELVKCTDPVREQAIYDEIERIPDCERCLAFANLLAQHDYIKACSYSDVWVKTMDAQGNVLAFVVCEAALLD